MLARLNYLFQRQSSFCSLRNFGGLARLTHFFLPQESNNYRAKALHHSSLLSFFSLLLAFQFGLSLLFGVQPRVLGYSSQILPEKIVELTNLERSKAGVPPLRLNGLLNEAAQRKAGDMFAFNYWAHTSPSGRDPWGFFKEVGYNFLYAGENLARDFATPEGVVAAWMASPSHRENLLNPKFHEIGISVVDGSLNNAETTLVVQLFGTSATSLASVPEGSIGETFTKETPNQPVSFGQAAILAQEQKASPVLFNPFTLTRGISLSILIFLLGIIILDGFIAYRRHILRLTGRSLAHFLFLIGTFLLAFFTTQGVIL